MAYIFGGMIVMIGYRGALTQEAFNNYIEQRPLKVITLQFVSLGGYLLIRYILEQTPDKSKKE